MSQEQLEQMEDLLALLSLNVRSLQAEIDGKLNMLAHDIALAREQIAAIKQEQR